MITEDDFKKLIKFLEENKMCIAGPVFRPLLGTHQLMPLYEDDYMNIFTHFKEYCEKN